MEHDYQGGGIFTLARTRHIGMGVLPLGFGCLNIQDVATYLSPAQQALLEGVIAAEVSYADHEKNLPNVRELSARGSTR